MNLVALIEKEGWMAADLRRAASTLEIDLTTVRWSDLSASVRADDLAVYSANVRLNDADAILLRTMRAGTFEQICFRMDVLHRLEASGMPVVNPPRAVEVAVDKYVALARARAAGLPTPDTMVCQKYGDAMKAFEALGGDVVLKPLFGSEGFGITRISDRVMAQRAFTQLERMGSIAYVQRYIPHDGNDYRLFVLADRVLASMRRCGVDWPSNIAQGGRGEPAEPGVDLETMALQAARVNDALVAGVDILVDVDGRPYMLEVNAVPGWRRLAEVTGIDVTRAVLAYVARLAGAGPCKLARQQHV